MEKYFFALKNSIQNQTAYRFNTFAMFFTEAIIFITFFYLWTSIYRQGGQVGSYGLRDIVLYYFAANFISLVVKGKDIAWMVSDEIRLGRVTSILLQPISYSKYKFAQLLGGYFFRGIIYFVVFSVIGFFLFPKLEFEVDLWKIVSFFFLMILGMLINFLMFYMIGLMTFWFGVVRGFNFGFSMLVVFLEGSLVPLDLLPSFVGRINDFLPFKYIMFVPISIFSGRMNMSFSLFFVPMIWILFLYILAKLVFKKGIKAYEGTGI